ncbi:P-loop containing nucleoside triphosphate hydrolase superfamily protein [Forsythia ovata]|uniref:P-loop containing nucleoside triphosphate hydrolase superfamily protein n=1 Tax=Forsythia ovata TaxID=205694 RepID=A0ABD1SJ04_9LAMI
MDGLWSNCGDERIIIFTTNHKEKIDPALLRPGRMVMHIHMSYCTPAGFDILDLSYLAICDHPNLFPKIKGLMQEVKVTPAEIAEHLMRNENAEKKKLKLMRRKLMRKALYKRQMLELKCKKKQKRRQKLRKL